MIKKSVDALIALYGMPIHDYEELISIMTPNSILKTNQSVENSQLILISANYFDFPPILWFYIEDFDGDLEYEIITQDYNNIDQMIYLKKPVGMEKILGKKMNGK